MIAGLALAVDSANVVGYTEVSVAAGKFYMVGAQFTAVGEATTIPMSELIKGDFVASAYKQRITQAPQIQILNADGKTYATYYYLTDAYDEANDDDVLGWANASGDLATSVVLNPGDSVWFKAITATNLKLSGQVIPEAVAGTTKAITIATTSANQFSMIANPFPATLDIADITWSGLTPAAYRNRITDAPQIQVLNSDGSTYSTYYYLTDAYDEANDDDVLGWANASGDLATTAIAPGCGFWLKLPTAGTVTATFGL